MSAGEYISGTNIGVQVFFQFNDGLSHDPEPGVVGHFASANHHEALRSTQTGPVSQYYDQNGFFLDYGLNIRQLDTVYARAAKYNISVDEELVRTGIVTPTQYCAMIADHLEVNFNIDGPPPSTLLENALFIDQAEYIENSDEIENTATQYRGWLQKPMIYIAGKPAMRGIIEFLAHTPEIEPEQICLTTEKALKASVFKARTKMHLRNAIFGLRRTYPQFSAARVLTALQGVVFTLLIAVIIASLIVAPLVGIAVLHVIGSFFYLALTLMRAAMILSADDIRNNLDAKTKSKLPQNNRFLPTYSILVALYKEAGQVAELSRALAKIDWPRDRLQILLICEADDHETIEQCKIHANQEFFEIIECPASEPRTKPKALDFALPLARGEFVVLYDAEDRPHPLQLKEAYAKFATHPNTACLQAPLQIHNHGQSWYTRMFAIEYNTLFGAILPVLEKWRSPFPLGGTSNHFRTQILRDIGAWDPFNVTEDADLGIRLTRFGYDSGTISCPTLEEAPPYFHAWFPQRTRWIKGWLQTFLVHMRHPMDLVTDLGARKALFFHLVISSVVISVLIHPIFFISAGYYFLSADVPLQLDNLSLALITLDIFNLVGGYTTYAALAWLVLESDQRRYLRKSLIWIPFYWLMISFAGWRALFQLFTRPFHWEKTEHGLGSYNHPK